MAPPIAGLNVRRLLVSSKWFAAVQVSEFCTTVRPIVMNGCRIVLSGTVFERSYWIVTHLDMRGLSRVRAMAEFILSRKWGRRRRFSGRAKTLGSASGPKARTVVRPACKITGRDLHCAAPRAVEEAAVLTLLSDCSPAQPRRLADMLPTTSGHSSLEREYDYDTYRNIVYGI
jgi:hypothetical protein